MIGIGTMVNTGAIVVGGLLGLFCGKLMKTSLQQALTRVCGVSVLFLGIAGTLEKMFSVEGEEIASGRGMLLILCLALGTLIGEMLNIEKGFERFGRWLREKTGNSGDTSFVDGFVTASLTVSIGAMAIVGSIQDGMTGDWSVLASKAVLDFIIVMVMTCSKGKGCIFSFIPVFLLQGSMTLLAMQLKPLMTELALNYISLVGSALIFCVGLNLIWGKMIRVANMLPSLIFAVAAAFLPFSF